MMLQPSQTKGMSPFTKGTFLLLLLSLCGSQAQLGTVRFRGELFVTEFPNPDPMLGKEEIITYALVNGMMKNNLQFSQAPDVVEQVPDLVAGMTISVAGPFNETTNTIFVEALMVEQQIGGKDYTKPVGVIDITSVTFVLDICGYKNTHDLKTFNSTWVNGPDSRPGIRTMQDYHEMCSYGKATFNAKNNLVYRLSLPCEGVNSWGEKWNANLCGGPEIYGWAHFAEDYARGLGLNLDIYKRRILILPPGLRGCGWAGLASLGCGSSCYTWINAGYGAFDTIFHELGHNLGMQHSTTPGDEYGWADGIASLDSGSLQAGASMTYQVPNTQASDKNFVRIRQNWKEPAPVYARTPNFYISYREAILGDSGDMNTRGLLPQYANRVSIHIFDGLQGRVAEKPELQATLIPGQVFQDKHKTLSIKFISSENGVATVTKTGKVGCTALVSGA
eukprot:gene8463-4907_t